MVKIYETGDALVSENRAFLNTNKYLSSFFFLDGPLLDRSDKVHYGLKVSDGENELIGLKVAHYSLLLFGSADLTDNLAEFLIENGYEFSSFMCSEDIGEKLSDALKRRLGTEYCEALAMDLMETAERTGPISGMVEIPDLHDTDEIAECLERFIVDCGLLDQVSKESIRKGIGNYRIVRADGKIASMAMIAPATDEAMKISYVYTRPEYRGKGYAGMAVNAAKNTILDSGMKACLNVDKKNPISNRLYRKLGFKVLFSQGEYRPK